MSARYNPGDGKRLSSQTHGKRGHKCAFCERTVYGNGGQVSHARGHVGRGEAVELVKDYATYPPIVSRIFVAADDTEGMQRLLDSGFEEVRHG